MSGSTRGKLTSKSSGGKDEKRGEIFLLISLGGTKGMGSNWLFIPFLVEGKSMLAAMEAHELVPGC